MFMGVIGRFSERILRGHDLYGFIPGAACQVPAVGGKRNRTHTTCMRVRVSFFEIVIHGQNPDGSIGLSGPSGNNEIPAVGRECQGLDRTAQGI